ncbi:hypothetical protein ACN38_g12640 [Penicillium nordicum]|uniref:Uncharacterized protein n=1 Tax=Penicillium nordicum TaxID=229535 RepID=A0A0M8NSW5_9EURO|nr:hypothetical protein ACN38_g12640 [Penicillium nordicum]
MTGNCCTASILVVVSKAASSCVRLVLGAWVPGAQGPLGTDPLCAVDSLSLSPSLLLLSVQPQAENSTVLFLQSQPRRFSVNLQKWIADLPQLKPDGFLSV